MKMATLLQLGQEQNLFRALDVQFAMMIAGDDQPAVMLAAALVSHDVGEGHVCLPLSRLNPQYWFAGRHPNFTTQLFAAAGQPDDWQQLLLASNAISENDEATPLKLKGGQLYLNRMWQNQQLVAQFFGNNHSLCDDVQQSDEQQIIDVLNLLFEPQQEIDWQKVAAAVALTRRISVISGGPGTGKTTTVAKLLLAMVRLAGEKKLRIRLAAPTGKAAARLTQSLGLALGKLMLSEEQKALLPNEASTLHRLLGAQANSQRLRYHEENPLHLDVLVVDEASMVDLPMMAKLIQALPAKAQVIFLGDRDQLASVEAGSVLGDICHSLSFGYSTSRAAQLTRLTGYAISPGAGEDRGGLCDALCLLQKSYRFDQHSGIGQLASRVNASDTVGVKRVFSQGFSDIAYHPLHALASYNQMIADAANGYSNYLEIVGKSGEIKEILDAFGRYQVLCALREGPFGVSGLNESIVLLLRQRRQIGYPVSTLSPWYNGRPVMVSRNDQTLGLFNGDIGIALERDDELRVWFALSDGSVKSVQPNRLPECNTAFAMTVHKSQGSEFDHVALVLPNQYSPVVTRELVYTAITRARKQLSLYGDDSVLDKAIHTNTERRSGLLDAFALQRNLSQFT